MKSPHVSLDEEDLGAAVGIEPPTYTHSVFQKNPTDSTKYNEVMNSLKNEIMN